MKNKYNFTNYLDKKLKQLESEADNLNYKIDEDIFYIECCNIITEAELKHCGAIKINSTMFWNFYNLVLYNIKNINNT